MLQCVQCSIQARLRQRHQMRLLRPKQRASYSPPRENLPQDAAIERKLENIRLGGSIGAFGCGTIGLVVENHHALVIDGETIDDAAHADAIDVADDRLLRSRVRREQWRKARIVDDIERFLREQTRIRLANALASEPRL